MESGPWSTRKGKSDERRASPIAAYSADKLMRWQEKLLKRSQKIRDMGAKTRHRLRLLNKKCYYSTEFFVDLFRNEALFRQRAALKHLRQAQKALGKLNAMQRAHRLQPPCAETAFARPCHFPAGA
jgi:CHAD domain-containing protein